MPPIIEARDLTKRYGDFVAVDTINLSVEEGELFGMLGPNGAGKTSTVRMIGCQLPVTAGELRVDGLDVRYHDRAIKARLGVVLQEDNLDPELTVRKNLEVYARYFDIPRATAAARIDEGLDLMQLHDRAGAPIRQLSGGLRRRLVIARALVNEPRILILDEPTIGLDPQARHLVWRKLRQLRGRGITILLTTHYMDEAEHLCDRLVIMDHGHILDEGAPRDLVARHVGRDALELRLQPGEQQRVLDHLRPALRDGVRCEQVEDALYVLGLNEQQQQALRALVGDPDRVLSRPANLEDVFLTLTGQALEDA